MKTRLRFKIIAVLICLSLAGLLISQGYWLKGLYLQSDGWMLSWLIFPLSVGVEFFLLELWNSFEIGRASCRERV